MNEGKAADRVRREVLPNGLVVLTEAMAHARTAAVAVATRHGSAHEQPGENGLSHFLEHFVFRGTLSREGRGLGRTGHGIAVEMDLLGGEVDAATYRESTCYSAECVADLLPRATDLLSDLVVLPTLPAELFEKERAVIREEIRSYEDSVADRASELSLTTFWPDHPLGRPIEGTRATLSAFTHASVSEFWRSHAVASNMMVSAAGALDHETFVAHVARVLGELPRGNPPELPQAPEPARGTNVLRRAHLEQCHVLLSLPGLPATHEDLPAITLLATALGGGMSSRLWMRIREDEGLAYDVSCSHSAYRTAGRLAFSVVTDPEHVRRALSLFHEAADALVQAEIPAEELERAFQHARGGLLIGLETPGARVFDNLGSELVFGRPIPAEHHVARLRAVTTGKLLEVARRTFGDPRRSLVALGPRGTPALGLGDLGS